MRSIFHTNAKGTNLLISALLISSSVLVSTIAQAPTATAQPYYPPRVVMPPPPPPPPVYRSGLNGVWRVSWQANGYETRGRLYMQGNQGVLRLRVQDRYGNMQRIEQTMFLSPRPDGFALTGNGPIITNSGMPLPNYYRIRQTPNGLFVTNCDSNRNCVPVMMQYTGSDTAY